MFDLKKRFIAVVRVGASATQGHERPQSRYVVICSERCSLYSAPSAQMEINGLR